MTTISMTSIPRNDLIGRIRRKFADLEAIGSVTDPVAARTGDTGGKWLESRLEKYSQPTLRDIREAAASDASASRRSAWGWALVGAVGAGAAIACALAAPAGLPIAAVLGVAAVGLATVKATGHAGRCEIASEVVGALDEWQIAYDHTASKGAVPGIEHVSYRPQS